MRDPFGPPPRILATWAEPLTRAPFHLKTLPLHIHEVLFAWLFYTVLSYALSPLLSRTLFPKSYAALSKRNRTNWDVHVVSFVQALIICAAAIYVLVNDHELASGAGDWHGRIFGYSGAAGLVQAMAAGYFLWDVWISTVYFSVQGPGSLAHAVSALAVTTIGFVSVSHYLELRFADHAAQRPFANYYGLIFVLYELSTPFLNIHWFLDKLNMTGSRLQWYNGVMLIIMFGCCRLVWGTYQSYKIYSDLWQAVSTLEQSPVKAFKKGNSSDVVKGLYEDDELPVSLAVLYLASNTLLVFLNFYWFRAMIQAVTKRFKKPAEKKQ